MPVFDLSQTEGRELPKISSRLDGEDVDNVFLKLRQVAQVSDSVSKALMKCLKVSMETATTRCSGFVSAKATHRLSE